jgi:hypothetical protein
MEQQQSNAGQKEAMQGQLSQLQKAGGQASIMPQQPQPQAKQDWNSRMAEGGNLGAALGAGASGGRMGGMISKLKERRAQRRQARSGMAGQPEQNTQQQMNKEQAQERREDNAGQREAIQAQIQQLQAQLASMG